MGVEAENDRGGSDNGIVVSECEANCEADRVIHLNCTPPSTGFEHLAVVLHNNHTDEAKGHFFVVKARGESYSTCPVRIGSNGSETPLMNFDFEKAVEDQKCIVGIHMHSVVAVASISAAEAQKRRTTTTIANSSSSSSSSSSSASSSSSSYSASSSSSSSYSSYSSSSSSSSAGLTPVRPGLGGDAPPDPTEVAAAMVALSAQPSPPPMDAATANGGGGWGGFLDSTTTATFPPMTSTRRCPSTATTATTTATGTWSPRAAATT